MSETPQDLLRVLPSVAAVMVHPGVRRMIDEQGREVVLGWVRDELQQFRQQLLNGQADGDRSALIDAIAEQLTLRADSADRHRLGRIVNATGVILHTGLGRAMLSQAAQSALAEISGAGNVEIDLETGGRRYRGYQLAGMWKLLTGCEDSLVVNNNAAATLLTLQALCRDREVIISRGQLIEIGGSFRLPEIFELSGARLKEVGTTNRTKVSDYRRAITPETAAVMHVHPSNYAVVGFADAPTISELVPLAREHNLLAIDDIGSGCLLDVTRYGLPPEPTFPASLAAGADVVLGSGDKLLGGPQAGIILGKGEFVDSMRRHPLARAVRIDKLTLGALSSTLESYIRGTAEQDIPTLSLLATPLHQLLARARTIRDDLGEAAGLTVEVREDKSPVGGGSLPTAELPTAVLALGHATLSADEMARRLRLGRIRILARIGQDRLLIDLRSVPPEDDSKITLALRLLGS